jgi:hypothetical protein
MNTGLETESIPRGTARTTVRLNLLRQPFRATDRFLDDWIRLSASGRIGTTADFRRRFCDANHYEVDVSIGGRTRKIRVFEAWGYPIPYLSGDSRSPLLMRILPKGWHLKQVGRSVPAPAYCRLKRPRTRPFPRLPPMPAAGPY